MTPFDAIVLAGGGSTRMGGRDKALVTVAGKTLLERSVEAVAEARRTIVVGPERDVPADVIWARESPPGGGPVAGLAAGLVHAREDIVVVLAVDMPLVDGALVAELVDAASGGDGAAATDADGHIQPLAAAYRTSSLYGAVEALGIPSGRSMRDLISPLELTRVASGDRTMDCDTQTQIREVAVALGAPDASE